MAAANVHIHIASTAPPPAIGVDFDPGTAILSASIATASPDIDVDITTASALGGALLPLGPFFTRARLLSSAIAFLGAGAPLPPGASLAIAPARTHASTALATARSSIFSAILPASSRRLLTAGLHLMHQALQRDGLGCHRAAAKSKHRPDGGQNQYVSHVQTSSRCPLASLHRERSRFEEVAALMTIVLHKRRFFRQWRTEPRSLRAQPLFS
ncbi:MAG TPA: hypothetical protein VFZ16_01240 [Hyphomicrobiaceae bacterium]|nr:hypothetical protein [Hyphomicrobiaceae bacterium]